MGISDHWGGGGNQNHFQAIAWSLNTKKAQQMLQFAKVPSFHKLTFLLLHLRYRI